MKRVLIFGLLVVCFLLWAGFVSAQDDV